MKNTDRVTNLKRKTTPILSEKFGPLQGIRVLSTGNLIAMPHAGAMMADLGAEVIHVEAPGVGDKMRAIGPFISQNGKKVSTLWADNARNRLSMELDLRIDKNPLSKEVFLSLVKVSDIWIENLVWLEQKYGITDELILEVNPKIVIVHESGYGKPEFGGDPDKCWRASSNLTGQAYSTFCHLSGEPDSPPSRIEPHSVDYITSFFTAIGALMGYIHAQKTGKGQTIDVSQFESTARILIDTFPTYLNTGYVPNRTGNKYDSFQPYDLFKASDGYISIGAFSFAVFRRFTQAMSEVTGINPDDYPPEECTMGKEAVNSPKGLAIDKVLRDWAADHTREEIESLLDKHKVAYGAVYTARDACEDPHWAGRDNFIECTDQTLEEKIKIFGIAPKLSPSPGRVWRGAPALGQYTEDILTRILSYTPEEINQLRAEKIICK